MGLLAPLYALAAAAVIAPIVFHLIRRQPRGQFEFSSLMFLQASPPRLTRRSRLDNLWLLLLRAIALTLIAVAFARPFLRSKEFATADLPGRDILLLIDTSGSMQREGIWERATQEAQKVLADLSPQDVVALATMDTKLDLVVPFPETDTPTSDSDRNQHALVRSTLAELKPSFRSTQLADQLISAAELLQARHLSDSSGSSQQREIVLVSDLHEGSDIDALQGFAWPESIRLDVRRLSASKPGNARATLMQASPESDNAESTTKSGQSDSGATSSPAAASPTERTDNSLTEQIRIRIENNAASTESTLELDWQDANRGPSPSGSSTVADASNSTNKAKIQVPPGQTRIVSMRVPSSQANQIQLSGDAAAYDNRVYIPRTEPRRERVGFCGLTPSRNDDDLFFFLKNVPLSTPVREVTVERISENDLVSTLTDLSWSSLVLEWPISVSQIPTLEKFAATGRPVIVVLSRASSSGDSPPKPDDSNAASTETQATSSQALASLLGITKPVVIGESRGRDFALLTHIDFRHPLFLPLADPKYNDFAKVRFWSHRVLDLPDATQLESEYRVLAQFDDDSPAIIHRRIERGDVWLLTAGWQTTASQLALSTKFVPLLFGMLDPRGLSLQHDASFEVGEPIAGITGTSPTFTTLAGETVEPLKSGDTYQLEQPGLYWLAQDGKRRMIAISLPQSESRLDPLDEERFSQYGVVLAKSDTASERTLAARQSQITELENRQKLWRWILLAAVGFLILETIVAARLQQQ